MKSIEIREAGIHVQEFQHEIFLVRLRLALISPIMGKLRKVYSFKMQLISLILFIVSL